MWLVLCGNMLKKCVQIPSVMSLFDSTRPERLIASVTSIGGRERVKVVLSCCSQHLGS